MPNSLATPADIFLPNWSHGGPVAFDVHVISPLQQQTLGEAAFNLDHAIQVGVKWKLSSYLLDCCSAGSDFIPLNVTEILGGLAEDTNFTFRTNGQAIGQKAASSDPSICTRHLFHCVAIAIWCGNVIRWLYHQPTLPPSVVGLV